MSSRKRVGSFTRGAVIVALVAATVGVAAATPRSTSSPPSISEDGWSADALLQLGNAHELAGRHGLAVLALERAHLLAPRDGTVAASLAQARTAAGVTAPHRSRAVEVLANLTTDEWTWIALAGALLLCAGVTGAVWRVRPAVARTIAATGLVTAVAAGIVAHVVAPPPDRAIVTATSTARISPFPTAEGVFEALEGESVRIEQERSKFFFVRDGERSGWVPSDAVERVIPAS